MKILTLNYATWRSGGAGYNSTGTGPTFLKNGDGFMCCLGGFSLQLNKDLKSDDISYLNTPACTKKEIPFMTKRGVAEILTNSDLSEKAMVINDNESSTTEERIELLKKLFKEYGFIIRVINKPKA